MRTSRSNLLITARIDSERDPSQNSIFDRVSDENVLDERIHIRRFLAENAILGVEGQLLGVAGIGLCSLDFGDKRLVEENLTDVGGVCGEVSVAGEESAVGADDG